MKTIFITMSRGGTARNILQTDVFGKLKESGNRIVILTPAWKDERFLKEFSGENVFFENLIEPKWGLLNKLIVALGKGLVYNDTNMLWDRYWMLDEGKKGSIFGGGNYFKYIIKKAVFWPLSKIQPLKELLRLIDSLLVKDIYYKEVFDKWNPDLVFSTSTKENADFFVLKQAKQRGIKTIGMVKTWDNTCRMVFRVKTEKLIVWGKYSMEEAKRFQNYNEKDIIMCGIPQFDFYVNPEYLMTREDFCRMMNIDSGRKIVVFCSEGRVTPYDGEVAEILAKFINISDIKPAAALLVRPHFMHPGDEKKFFEVAKLPDVILDGEYNHDLVFKDRWDYSKEQIKRFTNIIRHADVVITSASTISLDASAFDRPIINVAFDGNHNLPFGRSIKHWYISEYYKNVVRTDGVWMVDNKEELLNAVNSFLENPNLLTAGRAKLRDYFCHKIDGKSGERIAEAVLQYLK
jgi:hypothetical protein